MTAPQWQPFSESWRTTLLRTGALAVAIGIGVGLFRRQPAIIPLVTLLALWFTLGGHYVEVVFRNYLQPRLVGQLVLLIFGRLAFWFLGGSALYAGARATSAMLSAQRTVPWPWWTGGVLFIGVELLVHLLPQARGQPSFYNGRG